MESSTMSTEGKSRSMAAPTVAQAFRQTAREADERTALRTKGGEVEVSWADYFERAAGFAAGLAGLGLARGDTMALMMTNRPEFHVADAGAMLLGVTPFSIYNTFTPEQIAHLIADSRTTTIVTEQAFLPVIEAVRAQVPAIERVIVCDGEPPAGCLSYEDIAAAGKGSFDIDTAIAAVTPADVVNLIYTSGTTGPPKGVQISHANVMAACASFDGIIEFPPGARVVSYLPLAHIAARMVDHYLPAVLGWSVTCCADPRQVVAHLPEVRPNWFFAVPRIWEKLKAGLEAMIAGEADPERKKGMQWAIETGLKKVRAEQAGKPVSDELAAEYAKADEMVLSKIRAQLGLDELLSVNVGAAPTPPEVIEFFHAIGIPIAELWGMSETTGAGTVNPTAKIKIGTVGPASPGVEIKLADDGELLVRGPTIMPGYRNQPDQTAEAIDAEGWLHTGDIGEIDEDGYLRIVDRKKEIIINAAGKNMSPANIEARLKSGPLVGQAVAIGDGRPYNVALLTLDPDVAPVWAKAQGIEGDLATLAANKKVIEAVAQGVEQANEQLARVEQIKKFKLLPADWQPGGDELTPTMKLKRRPVAEKYAAEIEALYS